MINTEFALRVGLSCSKAIFLSNSLLAYLLLFPLPAHADGISFTEDRKHLRGEYSVIRLTERQTRDLERLRKISLNKEQLIPLRAIYSKFPVKLPVLSARWDDCTCGMGLYAVWLRPGEVEISRDRIRAEIGHSTDSESNAENQRPYEDDPTSDNIGETIIIDSKGRMWFRGKSISERELFSTIDDISRRSTTKKSAYRWIRFDLPPPINDALDGSILRTVKRAMDYARGRKVECSAMGVPRPE